MEAQAELEKDIAYFEEHFTERLVETGDRVKLSCRVWDKGAKDTLILIPGTFSPYAKWGKTIRGIRSQINIVTIDWPGIANSSPVMADSSIEVLTGHILRACRSIAPEGFILGGHSLGGMAAVEALRQAGKQTKLRAVISSEGWTDCSVSENVFGPLPAKYNKLQPPFDKINLAYREFAQRGFSESEKQRCDAWKRWSGYSALEETELPVLELWGDRSMPVRPSHEEMKIPKRDNITLSWIEGACHGYLISHPEKVAEAIDAFLESVLDKDS